jgi:hypothetical protein
VVSLRMADLTWSTIKTPALISEIRFRFGLSIDGDEKKNQRISRHPSIGRVFQREYASSDASASGPFSSTIAAVAGVRIINN